MFLVKEKDGKYFRKEVELIEDPSKARGLLHPLRWKILKLLAEKPRHASEIARILGEHEQKIYYHIRQLENLGLIKLEEKLEKRGALAKLYSPAKYAFALELPYGGERLMDLSLRKSSEAVYRFFYPHILGGKFNAVFVVGSPDPHGPYQVRARDGHYAVDLAHFLGQYSTHPAKFTVKLDVDVKAENAYDDNLILIGGVLTNVITSEINRYLPVRFETESFPFRGLRSELSGKSYRSENSGLIAKIPNPYSRDKSIVVFAGNRYSGTKAAVMAITKHAEKILESYAGEDAWAKVVEGKDLDGDGKIDDVEILE